MLFEKTYLALNSIIYPKKLTEILSENISTFEVFTKSPYVWCLVLLSRSKISLELETGSLVYDLKNSLDMGDLLFLDESVLKDSIEKVKTQIQNGIREEAYNQWFMQIAGSLSEEESICIHVATIDYGDELYQSLIFVSSEESLLQEPILSEMIYKAKLMAKEKVDNMAIKSKVRNKRNPIDSKLRHECFKRDGYKCVECGATKNESVLHCDHMTSVVQGGTDELSNLQTLCKECNLAKYNKTFKGGKKEVEDEKEKVS
jgi:hypothetical protein